MAGAGGGHLSAATPVPNGTRPCSTRRRSRPRSGPSSSTRRTHVAGSGARSSRAAKRTRCGPASRRFRRRLRFQACAFISSAAMSPSRQLIIRCRAGSPSASYRCTRRWARTLVPAAKLSRMRLLARELNTARRGQSSVVGVDFVQQSPRASRFTARECARHLLQLRAQLRSDPRPARGESARAACRVPEQCIEGATEG